MKTIRSFVVVLSAAATMACQTVSPGIAKPASPAPIVASASIAATPAAASNTKGRTILVLALLAGLVIAAILVSSSSDDGGIY